MTLVGKTTHNVISRGKILIVEDEAGFANELKDRLARMNYAPIGTATTGSDAIQQSDELRPDLVIMDMHLSGLVDGIEAADQIHAGFQIPVVYISSHSDEYTIERAKVTDPFGYLFRPFEDRELEIILEMALYRHRMEQEREGLIRELQEALTQVRQLSGLLPICLSCKKIRDDRGYWGRVEEYIQKHSKAKFTHGYCPDCARKLMQGIKPDLGGS